MWDSWEQQALSADIFNAAKRARTNGWVKEEELLSYPVAEDPHMACPVGAPVYPSGDPGTSFAMPQLQPAAPTGADDSDLTKSIFAALQNHRPNRQSEAAAAQPGPPQLGSMLLDSLRGLLPSGQAADASQGSDALQELCRVVHTSESPALPVTAPTPACSSGTSQAPAAAAAPRLWAAPKPAVVSTPAPSPAPMPVIPTSAEPVLAEQDRSPREEDIDSDDDGVPHRLPPGFGAIPEDIVEERARQREEQRVLQLKATQPCRFGRRCKKRDCPNAHPEGRDIDTAWNPCAFGRRCKRKGCFYDHPEGRIIDDNPEKGMCKFGIRCSRPDCLYDHPEGRAPLAGPDPRICYFCHDPGHIATDCPRNPESWNYSREAQGQVVQVSGPKAITANT